MNYSPRLIFGLFLCFPVCFLTATATGQQQPSSGKFSKELTTLRSAGPGKGQLAGPQVAAAWQKVVQGDSRQLTKILDAMRDVSPVAENWLRSAFETIAQRELQQSNKLRSGDLEEFVLDTNYPPRGRSLAYEWLIRVDPTAANRLLPRMLDDPSLELRRQAINHEMRKANKLPKQAKLSRYKELLDATRDLDQFKSCVAELKKLGQEVDIPQQLGFVQSWHLIAPFDNTDQKGFDVVYPPEREIDLTASYDGKGDSPETRSVKWQSHTTEDDYGKVDLNKTLSNHKGAISYAYATFYSDRAQQVELRLGCINANKVWLNGKPIMANEVYHAATDIDQYRSNVRLRQGENTILVKVCQNEQTQSWAQRWQFQLRLTDKLGSPIRSTSANK